MRCPHCDAIVADSRWGYDRHLVQHHPAQRVLRPAPPREPYQGITDRTQRERVAARRRQQRRHQNTPVGRRDPGKRP